MAAFTFASQPFCQRRFCRRGAFQLHAQLTKGKHPTLEPKSVQDSEEDLALVTLFVDSDDCDSEDSTDKNANGITNEMKKKIVRPPIENKAPQYFPEMPPHSALAQVIANQYGIDLASVSPSSKGPGSKITAEDVEYHAWKVSQPPCTEEALKLAYSLHLDLNDLYDDEDREYVLQLSDIELFQENEASLRMVSRTKREVDYESSETKMSALDKRMEHNLSKLSQKAFALAGSVASGIMSQTQTIASEKLREAGVFVDLSGGMAGDINTVQDFDSDLAREIQEALSSANVEDSNTVVSPGSGESIDDVEAVEDFDTGLASEIQEALSSGHIEDSNAIELTSAGANESDAVEQEVICSKEDLQSLTVVKLKDKLRRLGMKVSGRKAELIERLFDAMDFDDKNDYSTNEDKNENTLFFDTLDGVGDW